MIPEKRLYVARSAFIKNHDHYQYTLRLEPEHKNPR